MKGIVISMLVVLAMVTFMVKPGEAISCAQVDTSLASCISYLTSGGNPAAACCDGVKNLKEITPIVADRRAACDCVKAAADRYPNIKEDAASSFPIQCGVQMNIPISKNTNCANIN